MSHLDEQINTVLEPDEELQNLQFFQTQPHKCSYLPEQMASTVFLNPQQRIDKSLYSQLSELGFRRSGRHVYKPMCGDCHACIPMRVPVEHFTPNRSQKRTWKVNQDLKVKANTSIDIDEHYPLYKEYIEKRHREGDMYPPSREQFTNFLTSEWRSTRFFEFRLNNKLVACAVADIMDNGISAVYTYYAPSLNKHSLGRFAILYLIEECRRYRLPSLYLGYWIKSSNKMSYKSEYRPLEVLCGDRWLIAT